MTSGVVRTQFAQRAQGATAGVTSRSGRPVFAGSAGAEPKVRSGKRAAARTAPSARSAGGDLWSGFKPSARSSVFAAEASSARQQGGLGGAQVAALALLGLGLGLAGMAGVTGFAALRTRRAKARRAQTGDGTTEM